VYHVRAALAWLGLGAAIMLWPAVGAAGAEVNNRPSSRDLRAGDHGPDVRRLQSLLQRDGYHIAVDGRFGTATRRAVIAFQRSHHLPPDGSFRPYELRSLQGAVAAREGNMLAPASCQNVGATCAPQAPAATPSPPPTATSAATLGPEGLASAPPGAPPAVTAVISAGNQIATLPYRWGGGHASWSDTAYDCSGSVSYALHGAGLLNEPLTSGELAAWGEPGPGTWVTIYANDQHVWMTVAGLRFDTAERPSQNSTRWHASLTTAEGYTVRHPTGL
jgi:peptidoglycan hydrolase-like protein with peptidoglycan-binding domain